MNDGPDPENIVVGVVGAGVMGSGIAQAAAAAGFRVLLTDNWQDALPAARQRIAASLERIARKEGREAAWIDTVLTRVEAVPGLEELAVCTLAVEAVIEEREVKRTVLAQLDALLSPAAILASNTSTIPITSLASATSRPERVAGLHFFNPVPVMPLVEVIPGLATAETTVAWLESFARRLGKETIRCKDRPGFIANRLLLPFLNEAIELLDEGTATREDIDRTMTLGTAHPMGPLQLADMVGLDVVLHALEAMQSELGEHYRPAPLLRRMVEAGRLGRKRGRGFYDY